MSALQLLLLLTAFNKFKNANQRHLVTIACEALLMAMMMSALCKHTHKHIGMFEGSYEIKHEQY